MATRNKLWLLVPLQHLQPLLTPCGTCSPSQHPAGLQNPAPPPAVSSGPLRPLMFFCGHPHKVPCGPMQPLVQEGVVWKKSSALFAGFYAIYIRNCQIWIRETFLYSVVLNILLASVNFIKQNLKNS
jgi:hypothetical protein